MARFAFIVILRPMYAQVHYPDRLTRSELDKYLEAGWFRMGQSVFTTNFLHFKQEFYSAIWLRVALTRFVQDRTQEKLFKRNRIFKAVIGNANLDIQKEELFARYKQGISFDTSHSLYHLLHGKVFYNLFDTREITLYDDDKLIAAGYFDLGENTAAGITSFYDPEYRKYSLGKYLIYLKMHWCRDQGFKYFYPGYFVPGYTFFNYKLEMGREALEFYDIKSASWKHVDEFSKSPYNVMEQKLKDLQISLNEGGIESQLFKYEFFDAALFPELKDVELFDYPVFLNCFPFQQHQVNPMVVFDIRSDKYRLVRCRSIWASQLQPPGGDIYSFHLLMPEMEWATTADKAEMTEFIKRLGVNAQDDLV
ncbi:MAG TPA: GNAT family N-acetyltransferase [Ohtaekwangia sp.]|nr:GNAT family N-acetyltransferase [Ohtaekwangia sp.]